MNEQKVIKIVQELLDDERKNGVTITSEMIDANIERVIVMNSKWGENLDRNIIIDELIRRFSFWIGDPSILHNAKGHKEWLVAARKQGWRYWQRYQEYLERDLPLEAVNNIDATTDKILGMLEDPIREDVWDRRGLVVGHVQSGKTGNYTALICKAADAGYKIIIVLAGMHNNLRAQTQIRLDEGFLGFKTTKDITNLEFVGVGEIDTDLSIKPNSATTRANNGDFNTKIANHLAVTPEQRPWLFVVKKNKTVLKRLHEWIENHVANSKTSETGRKIVTNLPLLVIDDEADHASVDTGVQIFNEKNQPDEEYEPKAINSLIRKILHSFTHSAYVGYTATPFANIFIHEHGTTTLEGPDLFPDAFIMNLAAPSTHIGPRRIFGITGKEDKALPLLRFIKDAEKWLPTNHKNMYFPKYLGEDILPPSLKEAVLSFLLSCAVRVCRGQGKKHASMLIHVTRFVAVQTFVCEQVNKYLLMVKQELRYNLDNEVKNILQNIWNDEKQGFTSTNKKMLEMDSELNIEPLPSFDTVMAALFELVEDVQVKLINGTAKDALDYEANKEIGLKLIAVGGNKLSRGLTLEGLSVSYFLRASKMYDTLMQMGRWFGYRPNYLDVCRLYIQEELAEWFQHITDASEELREEFDMAMNSGMTPREYGLRVRAHPTLMVTSRVKMRTGKELQVSFSGSLTQTIVFHRDDQALLHNYTSAEQLFCNMGNAKEAPVIHRTRNASEVSINGHLWDNISAENIITFLNTYKSHPVAYRVDTRLLAEFIESMNKEGELTTWTVALIGADEKYGHTVHTLESGLAISLLKRASANDEGRYSIKVLTNPRDESLTVDEFTWNAALKLTQKLWDADPYQSRRKERPTEPSGPSLRHLRGFGEAGTGIAAHREQGLLLLYMLDPKHAGLDTTTPVVGLALSFPSSKAGAKVTYKVNNIYWEQEYGAVSY